MQPIKASLKTYARIYEVSYIKKMQPIKASAE